MTDHQFNTIMSALVEKIRADTPKDSGNLRRFATYGEGKGNGKFQITVDVKIAPYFHAVNDNEYHMHRDKKTGKIVKGSPNQNYHYFQKSLETHLKDLADEIGGTLEYEQL